MSQLSPSVSRAIDLFQRGDHKKAAEILDIHLRDHADDASAHSLAATLSIQRGVPDRAVFHAERAIKLRGAPFDHLLLANARLVKGQFEEGIALIRKALEHTPNDFGLWIVLAETLAGRSRSTEAEEAFEQAIRLKPDDIRAWTGLSGALINAGRTQQVVDRLEAVLPAIDSGKPRHPALQQALCFALNYRPERTPAQVADAHKRFGAAIAAAFPPMPFTPGESDPTPGRKLRIGYLSPDFRSHSVAFFIEPLLRHHDTSAFEVFCYLTYAPDQRTAELAQLADHWRDASRYFDRNLVQAVRADQLDILVDLAGLTTGGRLPALSLRMAPVQATYLGYPGTTGLSSVDYRLVDATTDPDGADALCVEKLVRLPGCFMCYAPPTGVPPAPPLPPERAGAPVFGSFNTASKLNERVASLWTKLLKSVPGSRLVLKARALSDDKARARIASLFTDAGLEPGRVEVRPAAPTYADHLAQIPDVDVALDTFPYTGATTTCEALWMGVPVVTLLGQTHAGRVSASLLTAAGLPELIAKSDEDYLSIARSLATDRPRLAALRSRLREQVAASPLCDGASFARKFEDVYRRIAPAPART